ncbi:MAG: membrane protein [Peptococcaceae bacterium BRH_c4b]|nr:MAG: membrane protein [Peptococcaceae bacterium BRH_c4b]
MLIVFIRTVILVALVVTGLRVMGKRQVGQLQPYELVIIILLSELAAIPIGNSGIPLAYAVIPILTLVVIHIFLSYISLKSEGARGIICGTPSVLIENGKIVEKELISLRYNINELTEQLRAKNIPNIADVEFAILETSGHLSVIPKSQKRPVVPADMNLPTNYEGLPVTLIIDGFVFDKNLSKISLNREWLQAELQKFGLSDFREVLFASIDSEGKLFYQQKAKAI